MNVPILLLMFVAMLTATTASLSDHASHAAAADLAELHASHAAAALTESCLRDTGCTVPPGVAACAAPNRVIITATVTYDARLWTNLNAATARRVVVHAAGTAADTALTARLAAITNAC